MFKLLSLFLPATFFVFLFNQNVLNDVKRKVIPVNFDGLSALESRVDLVHGTHSIKGKRLTMEDEHYPYEGSFEEKKHGEVIITTHQGSVALTASVINQFYGIYDGHGGKGAARYVKKHLHKNIVNNEFFATDTKKAILAGFKKTDKDFAKESIDDFSGTTVTTAFIKDTMLYIAHAGDGRAVLSEYKKVVFATKDHKPNDPKERKRIEAAGGYVYVRPGDVPRIDGTLAVARAIGDKNYKKNGELKVTYEPDIAIRALTGTEDFIILACDGVWDVMSNQQAVSCIWKNMVAEGVTQNTITSGIAHKITQKLVQEAYDLGSSDNISATVVFFSRKTQASTIASKGITRIIGAVVIDENDLKGMIVYNDVSAYEQDEVVAIERSDKRITYGIFSPSEAGRLNEKFKNHPCVFVEANKKEGRLFATSKVFKLPI